MTRTWESLQAWRQERQKIPLGSKIGCVPTMGALHEGHASLIRRSLDENDLTVVSVFVNPTQFDRKDDLKNYPRTWQKDLELLQSLGVHHVLLPSEKELYPEGYRYRVTESEESQILCGAHRPGHFDGVLTVVMKLLNLVRADRAYFGEKDFQQLRLVQGMVETFFMDTEIVPCTLVREPDGLAMSSRNARLSPEEREKAASFAHILRNERSADAVYQRLESEGFKVDYVKDWNGRRLAAIFIGSVRLIDNVPLER